MKIQKDPFQLEEIKLMNSAFYKYFIFFILIACENEKFISYHENGQTKFIVDEVYGKWEGKSIKYYEDGSVQQESTWKNGIKHGQSVSYYKNGVIHTKGNYLNGLANGEYKIFDSLGHLKEKLSLKDSIQHGECSRYYANGNVMQIEQYKNGKCNGECYSYYPDGSIHKKYICKEGEIFYLKGYDREGVLYDCKLPISTESIKKGDKYKIDIELLYSEAKNTGIGIFIGRLDNNKHLIDTIDYWGVNGLKTSYEIIPNNIETDKVTGILYEMIMPEQKIIGEYYFEHKF